MKAVNYLVYSCFLIAALSCQQENPVLTIEGGQITGVKTATEGVMVYRGIPYAAPPVGDLRWREPHPVIPWDGVKLCNEFGFAAIQDDQPIGGFYQHEFYQSGDPERSEDCLFLNVWTPASGKVDKKLPVALYIHGGGFAHGFGHEIEFDGESWAKRGVILITMNYRLGPLGFFSHPLLTAENPNLASGNQGILDQIAALNWIKNNIAQFGGDPENVTVFGQSAGAVAVGYLTVSPLTKELIDKAIIMSGGGIDEENTIGLTGSKMEDVQVVAKELYDYFDLVTLEQMRGYPAKDLFSLSGKYTDALMTKQGAPSSGITPGQVSASKNMALNGYQSYDELMGPMSMRFEAAASQTPENTPTNAPSDVPTIRVVRSSPIIDGYAITATFSDAARAGNLHPIPYMIGYVSNDVARLAKGIDRFCLLNEEQGNAVYAYEFARELPGDDAGAFHSGELWYVFNTLGLSWRPMTNEDSVLSERMVDHWTNFVKSGNPNLSEEQTWKPFTKDNQQIYKLDIKE